MYPWFQQIAQRVVKHLVSSSIVTVPAYLLYLYKKQESDQHAQAYQLLAARIKTRSSSAVVGSVFQVEQPVKMIGYRDPDKNQRKSAESITQISTRHPGAPVIWNKDGSQSELPGLSYEQWPSFIDTLSGDIFVTFGFRKAFTATNPVTATHAVVYVHDKHGNHAFFGYYKHNEEDVVGLRDHPLINDAHHKAVLPIYTLYSGLTIQGDQSQTKALLVLIEDYAKPRFTGWTMNCYTPLVAGLVNAESLGFRVPELYRESLLIVVPKERNYGAGMTPNRYFGGLMRDEINNIITSGSKISVINAPRLS